MAEFGTSGLRGLATDLTDELCATYAAAFCSLHAHNGRLFVGQDRRESSPRIARAVAAGAASQGLEVVDCGVLPTPALARASLAEGTIAIMVTGSHIPADRNGLKFYTSSGEFTKAEEGPLREAVAGWTLEKAEAKLHSSDAIEAFVQRYVGGCPQGALQGMKIGVWVHSSTASVALPQVLQALGAEVLSLGASEEFVPVDTEAVDQDTRDMLANWVQSEALDAIVSTDGDADRPLMMNDAGAIVPGDILGPITARWCDAKAVVTTVSANTLVDRMESFDILRRTRIGSPYVIAEMESLAASGNSHVVGYEPNGGLLLGWDVRGRLNLPKLMTRDCVLPLLGPLIAANEAGKRLSEYLADLPTRRTATGRLQEIPREASLALVGALKQGDTGWLPDGLGNIISVDETDGFRMTFETGRIVHMRPSGNAPELRCYVEAESSEVAEEFLSRSLNAMQLRVSET